MGAMLLLFATMVITIMRRMPARLTGTTGRIGLPEACLSGRDPGSTDFMAEEAIGAVVEVSTDAASTADAASAADVAASAADVAASAADVAASAADVAASAADVAASAADAALVAAEAGSTAAEAVRTAAAEAMAAVGTGN